MGDQTHLQSINRRGCQKNNNILDTLDSLSFVVVGKMPILNVYYDVKSRYDIQTSRHY